MEKELEEKKCCKESEAENHECCKEHEHENHECCKGHEHENHECCKEHEHENHECCEEHKEEDKCSCNTEVKEEKKESKKEKKNKDKEKILSLEKELKELKNEYLKTYAEVENTKRRLKEESIKDRKYASWNLVNDMLSPIDMLLKVVSMEVNNPEISNFLVGFKMISSQLVEVLKKDGLKEIDALNHDFDPNFHEAIEKVKLVDVTPNKVVEVVSAGYMYKDRVMKPALVKVSE